jgi:NTE family protein
MAQSPKEPRRTAIILSGGGARGAYEVGVLSYVFDEFTRLRGSPPPVDIICGTSVGAINGCFLAAHLMDPVLGFGVRQVMGIPRLALGGMGDGTGLFDVRPMADLVQREISWRSVTRNLRRRRLRALCVSTTEISTGRTVVFMQTSPDSVIPAHAPPRTLFRADHIGPQHALASAAIPLLFPPVRIDGELYLDGGLRQNTPIAPALRLGATHIFAIGGSREVRGLNRSEEGEKLQRMPGAAFLMGKILNAFLLDHVDVDLELLTRLNNVIVDGTRAYGESFVDSVSQHAQARGAPSYRWVNCFAIRPSEDIGRLASVHVRKGRFKGDPFVTKKILTLLDLGVGTEADLASYLMFDGQFCRQLIDMGRADARARRHEMMAFFEDKGDRSPPIDTEESGTWNVPSEFPIGT